MSFPPRIKVRDKLQRESSFFALDPCFGFPQGGVPRRGDIVGFRFPQQELINRFKRLRCMDFDRVNNRWVWLYSHESKILKFKKSYQSIPKEMHPIIIVSFFLRNGDELLLDLRSFDRAIEAIPFFDKHIGRTVARITHAGVVNRLFDAKEQFSPNLDVFFSSDEMMENDTDKSVPEVEKFPVHFYEEGITSIETVLRMR